MLINMNDIELLNWVLTRQIFIYLKEDVCIQIGLSIIVWLQRTSAVSPAVKHISKPYNYTILLLVWWFLNHSFLPEIPILWSTVLVLIIVLLSSAVDSQGVLNAVFTSNEHLASIKRAFTGDDARAIYIARVLHKGYRAGLYRHDACTLLYCRWLSM